MLPKYIASGRLYPAGTFAIAAPAYILPHCSISDPCSTDPMIDAPLSRGLPHILCSACACAAGVRSEASSSRRLRRRPP